MPTSSAVSMIDPAEEHVTHSESELATIADMTIWYQMPNLLARRLTQLNSTRWPVWNPYHITRIAEARRRDDTRDWYFTILVKMAIPTEDSWSSWSGIWHSTAHRSSERVHSLPPLTHLPHDWTHFGFPVNDIIASAGGLLLIKTNGTPEGPERRSIRLFGPVPAESHANKHFHGWPRLLVCNPLTRESRKLPAASSQQLGGPSWGQFLHYPRAVQAMVVVDDEANCYQVILTLRDFVAVYKSATDSWQCLRFLQARPWACRFRHRPGRLFVPNWSYHCASAYVRGGRLLFADVHYPLGNFGGVDAVVHATAAGALRLFQVDTEAGRWELLHKYTLRKFHAPVLNRRPGPSSYDMGILHYIQIVECMGDLYALIPAKLHDVVVIGETQTHGWMRNFEAFDDEYMPLVFYIMQLQPAAGVGVDYGVLRIQVPRTRSDFEARCDSLEGWTRPRRMCYFSCDARGSKIWVSVQDCLLTFDVVSLESTTQVIAFDPCIHETLGLAYRPSLHMTP